MLKSFFEPKSVAIIGVSRDFNKIGGKTLRFFLEHGYSGEIFPVTPKYEEIAGLKCYPDIEEAPPGVDLALIMIAAEGVLDCLNTCRERGVKAAIIFSSGFSEMGSEGIRRQEALRAFVTETGMLVCGPNCQGMVNVEKGITATFSNSVDRSHLISGNIGLITQSGAYGGAIFNAAQEKNMGISYWVSTGNEVGLTAVDFMDFMIRDSKTQVIACYLEGLRDVKKFDGVAKKALLKKKAIVVVKVGRSEVGKKAAASHTAALAGSYEVFEAFCKQRGVFLAYDVDELFDLCHVLALQPKLPRGNRVGIVTTSGGAGVSIADMCCDLSLEVPELSEETKSSLSEIVPEFGSVLNPVDVTAQVTTRVLLPGPDADKYKTCLRLVAEDKNVDGLIIMITMMEGQRAVKAGNDIVDISERIDKPILVTWVAGSLGEPGYGVLREKGIPLFDSPTKCVKALKALVDYKGNLSLADA
jgi:acetyltransferase